MNLNDKTWVLCQMYMMINAKSDQWSKKAVSACT